MHRKPATTLHMYFIAPADPWQKEKMEAEGKFRSHIHVNFPRFSF